MQPVGVSMFRRGSRPEAQTTTAVLFEADAQEFAATFPSSREEPEDQGCQDFWFYYDPTTRSIDLDLQGERIDLAESAAVAKEASRPPEGRLVARNRAVESFLVSARRGPSSR